MNIVFCEVAGWEDGVYKKAFPDCVLLEEPITLDNVKSYLDAEVLSCFIYTNIDEPLLAKMPNLKAIATRSVGYDHIDLEACKKRGIVVCNVPHYGVHTVAEHTFALILALSRKLDVSIEQARTCDFSHDEICGVDLFGKTLGIIGMGAIGTVVATIARGFGMHVFATSRDESKWGRNEHNVTYASLDTLLTQSDVVSIHVPYSPETHHLMNNDAFSKMKPGAFFINTARGGIVDTEALLTALDKPNGLGGAGIDVFEEEDKLDEEVSVLQKSKQGDLYKTLLLDHVLIRHAKVIVTPHNAFNSREALASIAKTTIDNISQIVSGHPINSVS